MKRGLSQLALSLLFLTNFTIHTMQETESQDSQAADSTTPTATQPVCGCTKNCTSNCPNPGMPEVEGRMWTSMAGQNPPAADSTTLVRKDLPTLGQDLNAASQEPSGEIEYSLIHNHTAIAITIYAGAMHNAIKKIAPNAAADLAYVDKTVAWGQSLCATSDKQTFVQSVSLVKMVSKLQELAHKYKLKDILDVSISSPDKIWFADVPSNEKYITICDNGLTWVPLSVPFPSQDETTPTPAADPAQLKRTQEIINDGDDDDNDSFSDDAKLAQGKTGNTVNVPAPAQQPQSTNSSNPNADSSYEVVAYTSITVTSAQALKQHAQLMQQTLANAATPAELVYVDDIVKSAGLLENKAQEKTTFVQSMLLRDILTRLQSLSLKYKLKNLQNFTLPVDTIALPSPSNDFILVLLKVHPSSEDIDHNPRMSATTTYHGAPVSTSATTCTPAENNDNNGASTGNTASQNSNAPAPAKQAQPESTDNNDDDADSANANHSGSTSDDEDKDSAPTREAQLKATCRTMNNDDASDDEENAGFQADDDDDNNNDSNDKQNLDRIRSSFDKADFILIDEVMAERFEGYALRVAQAFSDKASIADSHDIKEIVNWMKLLRIQKCVVRRELLDKVLERLLALAQKASLVDKNQKYKSNAPKYMFESEGSLEWFRKEINFYVPTPRPNPAQSSFSSQAIKILTNKFVITAGVVGAAAWYWYQYYAQDDAAQPA